MPLGVSWLVVANVATGLTSFGLLPYLKRYWGRPGATAWAAVLAIFGTLGLTYGVALTVFDPGLRLVLERVVWLAMLWAPFPFLVFALEYTGRGHLVRSGPMAALVVFEVVTSAAIVTDGWLHDRFATGFRLDPVLGAATVTYEFGVWEWAQTVVGLAVLGVAVVLLVETVLSYGPLYRKQAAAIALTPLFPTVAVLAWAFGVGPYPQVNFTAVMLLPHLALDVYALFGREMLEFPPRVRRAGARAALDDLGSPMLIVDTLGRLIRVNEAAEALFDIDRRDALGTDLGALVDLDLDPEADQRVAVRSRGERREFKASLSPFETPAGERAGYTVLLQDVTAETQRKQRIEVLNRILRHNLRNDLSVVQVAVEGIADTTDEPETAALAADAMAGADDLAALGDKVQRAADALDRERTSEPVDLGALASTVAADLRGRYPDGGVTVDVPDGAHLETDPGLLELVLANAVENALEHGGERPRVTVGATAEGDHSLVLSVADDGPGLPRYERAAIESGGEDALEHGSGVGLWLMHWGTTKLGGDLSFGVDDGGTTVRIRLPRAVGGGDRAADRGAAARS